MRRVIQVGLFLIILVAFVIAPIQAQATTVTTSFKEPLDMPAFIPCANGGTGESVWLSGYLHVLFHTTLDGSGGFHTKAHFNPQGVRGTGMVTGDKYQGTGVTQDKFNGKVGDQSTYINNFRIIGQGAGNNYLAHETFHITVNANGEVTAFVDNFSVECK